MKHLSTLALATLIGCSAYAQSPVVTQDPKVEERIEKTLKKMTLEEKVGQMAELEVNVLGKMGADGKFVINEALLDTIITKYKVGSILNTPGATAVTNKQWQEVITRIQDKSMKEIGIPCVYGVDQNHGASYTIGGTFFPQNLTIAASFNKDLPLQAARITAYETRAGNIPWVYSPTIDLGRDARWPRIWENYGEDCTVNAIMGSQAVVGFQGEDYNHIGKYNVGVSLKHFFGYGAPFSGKDRTPAYISPSELREKHFAPFLACIKKGAVSVMVNSASVNGMPVHANQILLTQWLKQETGWDGMVVTDWADVNNLWTREKVARDKKEALCMAINAGIDMVMEPYQWDMCPLLVQLVNEGKVPMSRIDDAVRRVLRLKYRLGLFDKPNTVEKDYPKFASKEHADAALHAAEECMVLLKNNNAILPLSKGKRLLVTGPNANSMRCLNGGWSYSWQGHVADKFASEYNTILEALQNKYGKDNIIYEPGVTYVEEGKYFEENTPDIYKAVNAAQGADIIIACIGENSYCETPGNINDINISRNQAELVKQLAKTGRPIILVLNEGRPRLISEIEPLATAVVDIILPGNYGGDALANLLAGDVNFSGRLPFTYPKEINSLINYDYKVSEVTNTMAGAYDYDAKVTQQWACGYGLSYTTFAYSNLKVNKQTFTADDELTFTVDVKNTGSMAGKESVLLYSSDIIASMTPENRRLRNFEKVSLAPGETKTVTLTIPASDLAFVGYDGKWILEEGDFNISVGSQVLGIRCSQTKKWDTPNR